MAIRTDKQCKFYVTNKVYAGNIELIKDAYSRADLYISHKLEIPRSKEKIQLSQRGEAIFDKAMAIARKYITNESMLDNLAYKLRAWLKSTSDIGSIVDSKDNAVIFIDSSVSKHECFLIQALVEEGAEVYVISKKIEALDIFEGNKLEIINTEVADLDYKKNDAQDNNGNVYIHGYTNNEQGLSDIKTLIGETPGKYVTRKFENFDYKTLTQLGKDLELNKTVNSNKDDYCSRLILNSHSVLKKYNRTPDLKLDILANATTKQLRKMLVQSNLTQFTSRYFGVLAGVASVISRNVKSVVYYGSETYKDAVILDILSESQYYNVTVMNTDKNTDKRVGNTFKYVELPDSVTAGTLKLEDLPGVNCVSTMAAKVQDKVEQEIYNSGIPGMFKAGQDMKIKTIRLNTIFEETQTWLDNEVFTRPGYKHNEFETVIPNMFKIISGVDSESKGYLDKYINMVSDTLSKNTILFRDIIDLELKLGDIVLTTNNIQINHLTDITQPFAKQLPYFENGKLRRDRIKTNPKYAYSHLPSDKQDIILNGIEKLIVNNIINYAIYGIEKEQYINTVLELLLNLPDIILAEIHKASYHSTLPRMVIMIGDSVNNREKYSIRTVILLAFLSLVGYDVLMFVPTGYNTIEELVGADFPIDKHTIGYPLTDVEELKRISDSIGFRDKASNKKQGWFSKLFK